MALTDKLSAVGDAIREKTGKSDLLTLDQMVTEISGIETGGVSEDLIGVLALRQLTEYTNATITEAKAPFCYQQSSLHKMSLPNCLSVPAQTFYGCTALSELNLAKLLLCENNVFRNCSSLVEVIFPNFGSNVSGYGLSGRIDGSAFEGCTKLVKADFAKINNTLGINNFAFLGCSSLAAFIIRSEAVVAKLGASNAFMNTPIANGTGYIYVPSALLEEYKTATNWSVYADQFRAIEGSEYE